MSPLRRLLSALMLLAVAQFTVVAIAPAHAHEVSSVEESLAVALHAHGVGHADQDMHAAHHLDHGAGGDHHGAMSPDESADAPGDGSPDHQGSRTVLHVHCCPHLAPTSGVALAAPLAVAIRLTPPGIAGLAGGGPEQPFRPPQSVL